MTSIHITTKRLLIRNLRPSDLIDFYSYRSDPAVVKYQGFDVLSLEECAKFIQRHMNNQFGIPGEWIQFGIVQRESGHLIGDCAIKLNRADNRLAEIGITIADEEQRQGYGKETLVAILKFLFSLPDFHRVTETVDADNIASIRLLETVGFRKEGHSIQNIFFKGKWGSEYQYAMLKKEWMQTNKK